MKGRHFLAFPENNQYNLFFGKSDMRSSEVHDESGREARQRERAIGAERASPGEPGREARSATNFFRRFGRKPLKRLKTEKERERKGT
jgi:hypothetical protein